MLSPVSLPWGGWNPPCLSTLSHLHPTLQAWCRLGCVLVLMGRSQPSTSAQSHRPSRCWVEAFLLEPLVGFLRVLALDWPWAGPLI